MQLRVVETKLVIGKNKHKPSWYCIRLRYISCDFCCPYQWAIFWMSANIFRVENPRSASQIWHAVKAPHHSSQSVRLPRQRSSWGWCTTPQQDVSLWRSSKAFISKTWPPTSHPVSNLKRFISAICQKSSEQCKLFVWPLSDGRRTSWACA